MDERERRTSEAYTAFIAIADDKEIRLTRWERDFVRDLLEYGGPLSLRQSEIVQELREKYLTKTSKPTPEEAREPRRIKRRTPEA